MALERWGGSFVWWSFPRAGVVWNFFVCVHGISQDVFFCYKTLKWMFNVVCCIFLLFFSCVECLGAVYCGFFWAYGKSLLSWRWPVLAIRLDVVIKNSAHSKNLLFFLRLDLTISVSLMENKWQSLMQISFCCLYTFPILVSSSDCTKLRFFFIV